MTVRGGHHGASVLGLVLALASCTGSIENGEPGTRSARPGGAPPAPPAPSAAACATPVVGAMPLRRLTREQYDRTVADLLGDVSGPAKAFAPDERVGPFDTNVVTLVSDPAVTSYMEAAEEIAARALPRLDGLLPCKPSAIGEDACARQFIETFGRRAYRRPLAADEIARYVSLYAKKKAAATFAGGIGLVIEAMLQSPHFLYVWEDAAAAPVGAKVAPLDGWALATRLSLFLWGRAPDAALLQLAAQDGLATPEAIERQARLMLTSDRAREAVRSFHAQLMGLGGLEALQKDPKKYPLFTDTLKTAMRAETDAFVDHVIFSAGGRLDTLLAAPYSFVNATLAPLYGVKPPGATGYVQQMLDPLQRAGLFTQAGALSVHARVVQRGRFIRESFFCQGVPPPPPDADPVPIVVDASASTRGRFAAHEKDPACGGCHRLMDAIGFGFLKYDEIGRFADRDAHGAIDDSGTLVGVGDKDRSFVGAVELAHAVAASPAAQACLATQWFRFGLGRVPEADDACSLAATSTAFAASGFDIRELMMALVKTDAFRMKAVAP